MGIEWCERSFTSCWLTPLWGQPKEGSSCRLVFLRSLVLRSRLRGFPISCLEDLWVLFGVGCAQYLCAWIRQTFKRISLFSMVFVVLHYLTCLLVLTGFAGFWLEGSRLVWDSDEIILSLTLAMIQECIQGMISIYFYMISILIQICISQDTHT